MITVQEISDSRVRATAVTSPSMVRCWRANRIAVWCMELPNLVWSYRVTKPGGGKVNSARRFRGALEKPAVHPSTVPDVPPGGGVGEVRHRAPRLPEVDGELELLGALLRRERCDQAALLPHDVSDREAPQIGRA